VSSVPHGDRGAPAPPPLTSVAEFAAALRAERDRGGLSLRALAEKISDMAARGGAVELSFQTLGEFTSSGKRVRLPDEAQLRTILAACGTNPDRVRYLLANRRDLAQHKSRSPDAAAPPQPVPRLWTGRVRAADCTVWEMSEFTATEAAVHTAIGRRHINPTLHRGDLALPRYVPRAHDAALRDDIADAAAGRLQALILLRGTSSTGKTRSLFEAVHELCPGWMVIRPRSAAALRALPEADLLDRPCVVWLNELQGFLGPNGHGVSLDVLRDLYAATTAPLVVVGTIWPEKLRNLTDDRDERVSDTRDLLTAAIPWVRWHDVPSTLTAAAEKATAAQYAATDPRLARALADPDRFGFAQTLAGAHELLEHYRNAPRAARFLFDAAATRPPPRPHPRPQQEAAAGDDTRTMARRTPGPATTALVRRRPRLRHSATAL
jgi:hypothetical protein